jgi:hypothetical protein
MAIEARGAPSPSNIKDFSKEDVLKLIIAQEIQPLFLRPHLDSQQLWALLIGWIGDRGMGKSTGCAVTSIIDHMMSGKRVFANMGIKCDILVDDDIARNYGLNSGGTAHYEAEPLDKDALLDLVNFPPDSKEKDVKYYRSCIVIEEINVEYSNVRRAMTNTNVDFNQVTQQLRHFETSLIYNVINEMFIDPQLRSLTDVFVKTSDMAFDINNLNAKKPRGVDFAWEITPTSPYLRGLQGKNKTLPPVYFHYEPWQGIFNTLQTQSKGIYSISTKDKNKRFLSKMEVESTQEMDSHFERWGWLIDMIQDWKRQGIRFLKKGEISRMIGRPLTEDIRRELPVWGCIWDSHLQGWALDDFTLDQNSQSHKRKNIITNTRRFNTMVRNPDEN